ncbi:Uncharacterised protein [Mycobacteroides abscessus subsp. abscessus]|nr:Uncharacterised protein [Mycobacteroides abscessus subsp. abscessus]
MGREVDLIAQRERADGATEIGRRVACARADPGGQGCCLRDRLPQLIFHFTDGCRRVCGQRGGVAVHRPPAYVGVEVGDEREGACALSDLVVDKQDFAGCEARRRGRSGGQTVGVAR